jgi:hypothetical protein
MKSRALIRMAASPLLNSSLVSASAAARLTLRNALSTSLCPVMNEMPLARKPTTGMTAMVAIRARTEILEMIRPKERTREVGSGMVRIERPVEWLWVQPQSHGSTPHAGHCRVKETGKWLTN